MTRPASSLELLSREECAALLSGGAVGRLAVNVDDQPHILPVNYAADGTTVVFRTAPETILNDASLQKVAFEVDAIDEEHRTGWSVCIHGVGREITGCVDDPSQRLLSLDVDSWAPEGRDRWYEIVPASITGRYLGPPRGQ